MSSLLLASVLATGGASQSERPQLGESERGTRTEAADGTF